MLLLTTLVACRKRQHHAHQSKASPKIQGSAAVDRHVFGLKRQFADFPELSPKKGFKNTTMANLRSLPIRVLAAALLCGP
ncbi:MAG: hypothetical protein ABSG62_17930 [Terracidiphilus sp.]|jgi:hypothetical protein